MTPKNAIVALLLGVTALAQSPPAGVAPPPPLPSLDVILQDLIVSHDAAVALDALSRYSAEHPEEIAGHRYRGLVAAVAGQWAVVEQSFAKVQDLAAKPGVATPDIIAEANSYVQQAKSVLARMASSSDEEQRFVASLARAAQSLGRADFRNAYLAAAQATKLRPSDPRPYVAAARALRGVGEIEQSRSFLDKALAVTGEGAEQALAPLRAEILAERDGIDRQLSSRSLAAKAREAQKAGQWEGAAAMFEAAFASDPSSGKYLRMAATCWIEAAKYEPARAALLTLAFGDFEAESRSACSDLLRLATLRRLIEARQDTAPLLASEQEALAAAGVAGANLPRSLWRFLQTFVTGGTDLREMRVCLGPSQSWVVLNAGKVASSEGLSDALAVAIASLQRNGVHLKTVCWMGETECAVVFDDNGYWLSSSVKPDLAGTFLDARNSGARVLTAAGNGAGGVLLICSDGKVRSAGVDAESVEAVKYALAEVAKIPAQTSGPRSFLLALAKEACWLGWDSRSLQRSAPDQLLTQVAAVRGMGRDLVSVALNLQGAWCIVSSRTQ